MKKPIGPDFARVVALPRHMRPRWWESFKWALLVCAAAAAGFMLPFLAGCGGQQPPDDMAECKEACGIIATAEGCELSWTACTDRGTGVYCDFGMVCAGASKTAGNYCQRSL